jgi:hypothetical protein
MSHCCGGCGGEDPLKKNQQTEDLETKKAEGKAPKETTSSATGTWQPPKK